MSEKDYSLLRPFDLEAAKHGDSVISIHSPECEGTFIGGPDCKGIIVLNRYPLGFSFWGPIEQTESLRMAPLCWVEGRPVYKGDVLYKLGEKFKVFGVKSNADGTEFLILREDGLNTEYVDNSRGYLTWTPPKVKREVKLLAYLDADRLFWLRETAKPNWPSVRIPSEDKVVEVEEPVTQKGGAA